MLALFVTVGAATRFLKSTVLNAIERVFGGLVCRIDWNPKADLGFFLHRFDFPRDVRFFFRSVDLAPFRVLFLIWSLQPEPPVNRIGTWWILRTQGCQSFQLLSAPSTTGTCTTTFMQLTRGSNPMNANIVEDFPPRNVEAEAKFVVCVHRLLSGCDY